MKVLLTGALGNVGSYTLNALLEEGHDVVAFDLASPRSRRVAAQIDERVHVTWGDITDPASIGAALEGVDAVVHLAAIIPPHVEKAPDLARRVNVDATRSLIEQMEASPTARRLVFASSQGVFGDVQDREPPLRVETPVSPTDEYGRHKVACERAIQQSRLRWSILRLAVAVPTRLIGAPFDLRSGFEISADARIEIIHPADAGTAFARALACEEAIGKILHVGGGEKCQMLHGEFFDDLMGSIGIGPIPAEAFVRTPVPRFMGDWLDTDESQRLLKYQERGLSELTADMRRDLGVVAPLIRLLRPLVTWYLIRSSPYLEGNRRSGSP
jgi:nucleoside-diphosphate-sugar epimerase